MIVVVESQARSSGSSFLASGARLGAMILACLSVFLFGCSTTPTNRIAFNMLPSDLGIPQEIRHSGTVTTPNGTYKFRFAIVAATGADKGINLWSNDGTRLLDPAHRDKHPNSHVEIKVENGKYTVVLGRKGKSGMTMPIPSYVFFKHETRVRTWFNDGTGLKQLRDRRLVSVPYAYVAGNGVPVGTIVAWHKRDVKDHIALPDSWRECNGKPVDDPSSPFHGKSLPNLNGTRRFLRGGSNSGVEEADAFQGHGHRLGIWKQGYDAGGHGWDINTRQDTNTYFDKKVLQPVITPGYSPPRVDDETRPINMSVVWIIKIK